MVRKGTPEALLRKVRLDPGLRKVRKSTPAALLRKVRLDPGSPKMSGKVPLWSIVAQGPLGSEKVRKGTPGALLRKVRLDPGSPKRSKIPLEHCCARSAWIQGLRKGPKRYPWSVVAQGPLGSRVSKKVRKNIPGALLRKVSFNPGSPKRSEKVPLEHCCARSAWIQGLRKGPKRYPWSIVAQIQGLRKGPKVPLEQRKVRLDPGSPRKVRKGSLEHCCGRSAWFQGFLFGPFRRLWIQADLAQQCFQGCLFGPFRRPYRSKRTLRNNAPGVPFRTFSETLDPSGPCAITQFNVCCLLTQLPRS